MVGPSIIFYIIFAVPFILVMYWLVKQDKKKHALGIVIITVLAIIALLVSQKASKMAVDNYKQHQEDARTLEAEQN